MQGVKEQKCVQCGTCCLNGGPVLHHEDKKLILAGNITYSNLVTLRKGELVIKPKTKKPEPIRNEVIKIRGRDNDWCCRYFAKKSSSCTIYEKRPLECRLLKCWDTAELERVVEKDTIKRIDIINENDPVQELIEIHDRECSAVEAAEIMRSCLEQKENIELLDDLTALVRKDLNMRAMTFIKLGLSVENEFFLFGRPLFKLLEPFGFQLHEENGNVTLILQASQQIHQ